MKGSEERSLLVIIMDISPTTWGARDMKRKQNDEAREKQGKRSVGPATLEELLTSTSAFCGAFSSLNQDSSLLIIGVASSEVAVLYPRKDELHGMFQEAQKLDTRRLQEGFMRGTAELTSRAAQKAETAASTTPLDPNASMAAALSMALCCINRFLVATNSGVSALASTTTAFWKRQEDEGVVSMLSSDNSSEKNSSKPKSSWSPRIFIIQASQDRSRDYNAIMNCAFAATKQGIVIDACFIPSGITKDASPFLEQVVDKTGGVFLAPSGPAQAGGALTEVMLSVFLSPPSSRSSLNLPAIQKVDFRARCFETGDSVDMAYVCNICLSIFKSRPNEFCPTCGVDIKQ